MKTKPVKDLYCKIDFTEKEKIKANKLALIEFQKPVHERLWIEKIIDNIKGNYKYKASSLKFIKKLKG